MLVVCDHQAHYSLLLKFLRHYFPSAQPDQLHLQTKYYSADVHLTRISWPTLQLYQSMADTPADPTHKYDLMVMLVDHGQPPPPLSLYDLLIQIHNPDNFLLIVNTPNKGQKWSQQQAIAEEVNNFIEIVREDLQSVVEDLPLGKEMRGLLSEGYEDGSVFNLVGLMETTQWSCIERKDRSKNNKGKDGSDKQKKEEGEVAVKQQAKEKGQVKVQEQAKVEGQGKRKEERRSSSSEEQQQEQEQPEKQNNMKQEQEQVSEEQLERQMEDFESMFRQMMAIKAMQPPSDSNSSQQRKQQAQLLINQLLKGSFF